MGGEGDESGEGSEGAAWGGREGKAAIGVVLWAVGRHALAAFKYSYLQNASNR